MRLRLHGAISGIYALSRLGLLLWGVRFHADYEWQHFHDVTLLKERLWESLLYTHAFTPFISMLAGVVLKISEPHAVLIYQGLYLALGLLFVNAVGYLLEVFRVRPWLNVSVVSIFSLTPAFIYFESFFHYEFMAASLLAVAAALFHRALARASWQRWLSFFLVCALIAYVRTSFHLVWLVFLVGMALAFQRQRWRTIAASALVPVLLVIALYAKNQVLFGFFGSSSWFGFNMAIVTTKRLSKKELKAWIAQHKISPMSGVGLYSGPEAYAKFVNLSQRRGIPILDQVVRQNGNPNYNHWSYIEISKQRMRDNRVYLRERPWAYVNTVLKGVVDYLRPTSRWHPFDAKHSPHLENRRLLGPWENFYNRLVHTFPVQPVGVYPLVIALVAFAGFRSVRTVWRSRTRDALSDKLTLFMVFNAAYVPALSCLVTIGELERYRFMVEGFMWVVCLSLLGAAREQTPPGARASTGSPGVA